MKYLVFVFMAFGLFLSCDREEVDQNLILNNDIDLNAYKMSGSLESDPKEIMRNAILEMTELSKKAFLDENVRKEISQIIKSSFYIDHVVALNDLLDPVSSLAYKYTEVDEAVKGSFAKFYNSEMSSNIKEYPNLDYIQNTRVSLKTSNYNFFNQARVTLYLPYDINDSNSTIDLTRMPVLVPAVIESNSGVGSQHVNNLWEQKIVSDNTSANEYTIVVQPSHDPCSGYGFAPNSTVSFIESIPSDCDAIGGITGGSSGGGSGGGTPSNIYNGNCVDLKGGGAYVRQVFIGRAKNNGKQFDKLISLTGNGGGSEIRYCRADSKKAIDIDSLGNYTINQWDTRISQYWKRKQIRKENVRRVSALWDQNWECEGTHEQLFVIYEDDNQGDLIIDQDLEFEIADSTYAADIDVRIQNRSKDDAIILRTRERVEFFATNLLDQGCSCWDGDGSFADRCWGKYDCGADMTYTMYHRWVYVGDNSQY